MSRNEPLMETRADLVGTIALHDRLKARARQLESERTVPWEFVLPSWILRR